MTWIRWECQAPSHVVVARIAEALKVRLAEALGLFNGVCCGMGEHRPDGDADLVPDTSLELWAQWQGKKGRFAVVFREHCVERREGEGDAVGTIKGWWRQRALLEKQARDALKRKHPPETPAKPPINPRGFLKGTPEGFRGDEDEDEDGNGLSASKPEPMDSFHYTIRCTAAVNRGLRENPALPGFNELVSSNQDEPALWRDRGIPIEIAERAIYHRAKSYRPKGSRRQPVSLNYFRQAVEDEWMKSESQAHEAGVNTAPLALPEIDEWEILARRVEADAAKRAS